MIYEVDYFGYPHILLYDASSEGYLHIDAPYGINDGWNTAHLLNSNYPEDWGKFITFTSEQEVSEEFYTWFTANATKQ